MSDEEVDEQTFIQTDPELIDNKPKQALNEEEIYEPTLKPAPDFDAAQECEVLRNALNSLVEGLGMDEEALVNVLCRRSWQQRMEIIATYRQMYGKDLMEEISSETSFNFRKILKRLLKTPIELAAYEAHKAIVGLGTDEECLIELICTNFNEDLKMLKETYKTIYGKTLEEDVLGDTSGYFRRLLVALLRCNRPPNEEEPDLEAATYDAQALFEAGENQLGTNAERFITILCNCSFQQLRAIFDAYTRKYKKDIAEAIKFEFSGDISNALQAIIGAIRNRCAYFAGRLNKAMKGLGTDDNMLLRIIVSRCEFDLGAIKKEYARLYGKSLRAAVEDDTSGDYKNALLTLIGN